ncbi:VENN motif pre-toxin domain-containing protein, partial [Cronobacter dublinensis]|uniref:VENN motif pre-toxin domain-containing protein n=1 Tax=Cronobacter dublinensis TaxID=413497 RepID=UPI001E2F0C04
GASGAAVGEAMGYLIAKEAYKKDPSQLNETEKQTVAALSTLASGLAGALAGNSTEAVATAAKAGQTTVENNFLGESSRKRKDELVQKGLTEGLTLDEEKELVSLDTNNQLSDEYLDKYRHDPGSLTPDEKYILNRALTAFYYENLKYYYTDTVNKMVGSLFAEGATFRDYDFPYAASSELKNKITDINKAGLGFWDALTYTRDISPQERLYKDAISDLGVVNEHAYWARVGEPVLNFLPGAPGFVVNVKDAITGGSQMGQATASFLNDGPNADSAGRFLEGFLNATGAVAGTHWGYKGATQPGKQIIGVPVTQSENPLNPVQQYDAHGNEIVYRTMSQKQYEKFLNTGVMPATTETSFSPVLGYSSKYDGVTVKIVFKPGTFSELEKVGIAANSAAAKELPNMSTQTGKWMETNTRFKVEGGQMTTQLGQGKGMEIFNKNIVHFEKVQ